MIEPELNKISITFSYKQIQKIRMISNEWLRVSRVSHASSMASVVRYLCTNHITIDELLEKVQNEQ